MMDIVIIMNKRDVRIKLESMFTSYHINQWLLKFPDDFKFNNEYCRWFIEYINELEDIHTHPNE